MGLMTACIMGSMGYVGMSLLGSFYLLGEEAVLESFRFCLHFQGMNLFPHFVLVHMILVYAGLCSCIFHRHMKKYTGGLVTCSV